MVRKPRGHERAMHWHYLKRGEKHGPISEAEVAELIERGEIGPNDLVWHPGLSQWIKASDAVGLFVPPPLPAEKPEPRQAELEAPFSSPASAPRASDLSPQTIRPKESVPVVDAFGFDSLLWIKRHWRGDLPLGVSYWLNGLIVYIGLYATAFAIAGAISQIKSPYTGAAYLITFWLVAFALQIWLWVGIWRSANRHIERTGRRFWASLAKVMVALGVLSAPGRFLLESYGWQAIVDSLKHASQIKEFSKYEIRPLRDGSEIEISGGLGIGIADAFEKTLAAHPNARVIHLNSSGGLRDEARKIRDLISAKGLITYTSTECISACTLTFMGGSERFMRDGAKLGFHQPQIPVLRGQDLQEAIRDEEDYLVSIGVSRDFAHKALSTPPSDIWLPAPFELLQAHVITGITQGDEFGLSGIKGWKDQKKIESELLSLPLYQMLKTREPVLTLRS